MGQPYQAVEKLSLEESLARLKTAEAHAKVLLERLNLVRSFPRGSTILDVGAAQGRFLVACAKMGYRAVGIEPWQQAIAVASELAEHEGVAVDVVPGVAEALPFPSEHFRLVHAMSVMEHVGNVQKAFQEAWRVLKHGGMFWFYTASSICPRQGEIQRFPCFGWYPDRLKRRIMLWAAKHKPHLVGHTTMPALNWFTPWKARRMLHETGFRQVYDRWDLPFTRSTRRAKRMAVRLIRATFLTKLMADVMRPGCSYLAVK